MLANVIIDRDAEEYFEASRVRRIATRIIELPADAWDFLRYAVNELRNSEATRTDWLPTEHTHAEDETVVCCPIREFMLERDATREEMAKARKNRERWNSLMTTDERKLVEQT